MRPDDDRRAGGLQLVREPRRRPRRSARHRSPLLLHAAARSFGKHSGQEGVRPVGYVDLDDGVRTLADIREGGTPLRPDMRVELGTDGDDWFFAPARDE